VTLTNSSLAVSKLTAKVKGYDVGKPDTEPTTILVAPALIAPSNVVSIAVDE
jgi:hypothetical protein